MTHERARGRAMPALLLLALVAGCQAPIASPSPATAPPATAPPATGPLATPAATPTAAPADSPAASLLPAADLASSTRKLDAGRYTRRGFEPRITFEVPAETWRAVNLLSGFFDVEDVPNSPDVIAVQFAVPSGVYGAGANLVAFNGAEDARDQLAANTTLTMVETSGSLMDGREGFQITVENSGKGTASIMQVPPGALGIVPGRRLWVAFFDTPDGVLAIMVGGSTAKWEESLALAEPVLETVTIGR